MSIVEKCKSGQIISELMSLEGEEAGRRMLFQPSTPPPHAGTTHALLWI